MSKRRKATAADRTSNGGRIVLGSSCSDLKAPKQFPQDARSAKTKKITMNNTMVK
jgi:hypothetical protein